MKELEYILEEIKACESFVLTDNVVETPWQFGFVAACNRIRKIINCYDERNGWIPLKEKAPKVPMDIKDEDCPEFEAMAHGEQRPLILKCNGDGIWFAYDDGDKNEYNVIAWRPIPQK